MPAASRLAPSKTSLNAPRCSKARSRRGGWGWEPRYPDREDPGAGTVVATAATEEKREYTRTIGADFAVDYEKPAG